MNGFMMRTKKIVEQKLLAATRARNVVILFDKIVLFQPMISMLVASAFILLCKLLYMLITTLKFFLLTTLQFFLLSEHSQMGFEFSDELFYHDFLFGAEHELLTLISIHLLALNYAQELFRLGHALLQFFILFKLLVLCVCDGGVWLEAVDVVLEVFDVVVKIIIVKSQLVDQRKTTHLQVLSLVAIICFVEINHNRLAIHLPAKVKCLNCFLVV
jgi:hypothetical protein